MKVKEYFDSAAESYNKERTNGIHGYFANKVMKTTTKILNIKKGEKILDVGCGSGLYSIIIKQTGAKPYGIDISKKMINKLKERRLKGKVVNVENFNLNKRFDKVLCVGVFEFLNSPKKATISIQKHLYPNKDFILVYPRVSLFGGLYFLFHFILHGIKIKLFTKKQIEELLKKNGFSIVNHKKIDVFTNIVKAKNMQLSSS